jgi:hypothetical protein
MDNTALHGSKIAKIEAVSRRERSESLLPKSRAQPRDLVQLPNIAKESKLS